MAKPSTKRECEQSDDHHWVDHNGGYCRENPDR